MTDKELIIRLGGVVAVSDYLGVSYQCVFNWLSRGIPSKVKLDHQDVFLSEDPQSLIGNKANLAPEANNTKLGA